MRKTGQERVEKKGREKQALSFTSGAPFRDMTSYMFIASS